MSGDLERLLELARGHWAARVLATGAETGILGGLREAGESAAEVAARAGTDPEATRILLDALVALGAAEATGGSYRRGPAAAVRAIPYLRHMARGWAALSRLTDVVRKGARTAVRDLFDRDPDAARDFALGMEVLAESIGPGVAARIDMGGRRRLLDVGCGAGSYSILLLRRWPELEATLVDRPAVLALARERIGEAGLSDRASFVAADYLRDRLPAGADAALLSAVVHQHRDEDASRLLRAVAAALPAGGRLVIRDWVMDESRIVPGDGAVFAAAILCSSAGGRTRSAAEWRALLEGAGFGNVSFPGGTGKGCLVIAARGG